MSADVFEISSTLRPISIAMHADLKAAAVRRCDQKTDRGAGRLLKSLNKKHTTEVTVAQYLSLRHIALKDKVIKDLPRIYSSLRQIANEYRDKNILYLSKKYKYPPLRLLFHILTTRYQKNILQAGFYRDQSHLEERDRQMLALASDHDQDNVEEQRRITQVAQQYEDSIVAQMRAAGIVLTTQSELTDAQVRQYGRPLLTPDALFQSTVLVNGERVYWLDVKDYYYYPGTFLDEKLEKQAEKYYRAWGRGVMYFHYSHRSDSNLAHTCLL